MRRILGRSAPLDQLDPAIGRRIFKLGADDAQLAFIVGGYRADQTGTIAAAAFCFVEGLIDEADGAVQRDLRLGSSHRKARVSDGNRALDGLSVPQHGVSAHRVQKSFDGSIRLFRRYW